MRTIRIKAYKFDELSDQAKETAISNYRNKEQDNQHYYDEITDSVKAVIELFGLKTGNQYSDIRTGHIDDTILQLSGARLYAYIVNNYPELFKGKYIKSIDRKIYLPCFICHAKQHKDGAYYTTIYRKWQADNSCVLTGMCYDDDILRPVYEFLAKPDKSDFEDLMKGIESAISKAYSDCEEWLNSDEFISEELEVNEYEFTKEGKLI